MATLLLSDSRSKIISVCLIALSTIFGQESHADSVKRPPTKVITVRGLDLGSGRAKIMVPMTDQDEASSIATATSLGKNGKVDLVEFRVDYLKSALDSSAVVENCKRVREALDGKPLLITFRTKSEGGETEISDQMYEDLNLAILRSGTPDFIDIELNRGDKIVKNLIAAAHRAKVATIVSNHDFKGTPKESELISRLTHMEKLGADVLKIAMMPKDTGDVLTLLSATWKMSLKTDRPLITMSMAGLGGVSRLSAEVFGSAVSIGMVGKSSAPGQIEVEDLSRTVDLIHKTLTTK